MTREQLIEMAVEQGFSAAAVIGTESVPFDPAFRPLCEENLCGKYGVNYACPPDCGTPEEMQRKVTQHRHALVLQTLWQVDDFADTKVTGPAKAEHNAMSLRLVRELRKNGYAVRWLGWGCRYSGQTPPPAADAAKSHRWSDSPNPTSKHLKG